VNFSAIKVAFSAIKVNMRFCGFAHFYCVGVYFCCGFAHFYCIRAHFLIDILGVIMLVLANEKF